MKEIVLSENALITSKTDLKGMKKIFSTHTTAKSKSCKMNLIYLTRL